MDVSVNEFEQVPPGQHVTFVWVPDEGETVSVLDYPSTVPLGFVDLIERDSLGAATTYWVWMLDGTRISLDAATAPLRLGPA